MITKITKITLSASGAFLVIMIAACAIFSYLLIDTIYQINDKVAQVEISTNERDAQGALKVSVANSVVERQTLDTYFISKSGTADFIKTLEALAKGNNVSINIKYVGYEPIKQANFSATAESIRFNLDLIGSWVNCIQVIRLLENLPVPSLVEKITLSVGGTNLSGKVTSGSTWTANVDFTAVKLKN